MPVTPNYALPYPQDSDDVDVPGDMGALATAVDTALLSAGGSGGYQKTFLLMGA